MSPRPKKPRTCCCMLRENCTLIYKPAGTPLKDLKKTIINHDEIEAMHLCDGLCLTQQQAGERMGISRGTVQRLVVSGRKKLIDALLEGHAVLLPTEESATATESFQPS
ncbi:DUF134 domain-containing protein [Geopsychrobacter electrodiphilus]|uniref:DUF134 domain-containing protein n=1 Tax=Geopsychrobacter electrodiphilus TaxID=225196 RepID=UPI000527718B|nr:DUF134 domain-containing protein [Geopsychrobacter electrodiphilus]